MANPDGVLFRRMSEGLDLIPLAPQNEIDLSAVPVPPDPEAPEVLPSTPAAASAWGPPPEPGESEEAGPPTEALVVLDEELADSGPSGASSRRRG